MYQVTLLQDTLIRYYRTGEWQSISVHNNATKGRVFTASRIHYCPNGEIELTHPRGPDTVYVLPAGNQIEVQWVPEVQEVTQSPTLTLTVRSKVPYTYGDGYKSAFNPTSQCQITACKPAYGGYDVSLKNAGITIFIKAEDMVNVCITESKETNFRVTPKTVSNPGYQVG